MHVYPASKCWIGLSDRTGSLVFCVDASERLIISAPSQATLGYRCPTDCSRLRQFPRSTSSDRFRCVAAAQSENVGSCVASGSFCSSAPAASVRFQYCPGAAVGRECAFAFLKCGSTPDNPQVETSLREHARGRILLPSRKQRRFGRSLHS